MTGPTTPTDRTEPGSTERRRLGEQSLWHPFANMAQVAGNQYVVDRAEGVWLWNEDGERLLDASASLWYSTVGHGRAEIREAVDTQMAKLDAYSIFGDYANPVALDLAARLAELSPMEETKTFLTTGGGESIDTAAKIARRYHQLRGQPERTVLIGRTSGYHGTNGIGTALGGIEDNRVNWGPLAADTELVAYDSVEALERTIGALGPDRVAAFFIEPVIGAGGVLHPPAGYVEGVAGLCEEHGILFCVDEVICGFGRLGRWFGIERWDVLPDLMVFAKGSTSGHLPLGGVMVSGEVAEPFYGGDGDMFRHGPTYSGHATCCAAAHANLDILESEGLIERALEIERWIEEALRPLAERAGVREVRAGLGVLGAVELDADLVADRGVQRVFNAARERGVLLRPLGSSVAVSPPLVIERDEVRLMGEVIGEALAATVG